MRVLDLSGNWRLEQAGRGNKYITRSVSAEVPGCVHTDLLRAGLIDEPYYRDNENHLQWIGQSDWQYSRRISVPAEFLEQDRVLLRCEGLDTLAMVCINGWLVGEAENMFRTWEFDVKEYLRPGENEISVYFVSVEKRVEKLWPDPRQREENARTFKLAGGPLIRKNACNFGWDWGPKLMTCGIWRGISLVGFNTARLEEVRVWQEHRRNKVQLTIDVSAERLGRAPLTGEASVSYLGRVLGRAEVIWKGRKGVATITVSDPKLWWPAGMGDQPLYEVSVTLRDDGGQTLDSWSRRIGLRTLELARKKDRHGEAFFFKANGVAFFAKGANWIPADTFPSRVSRENYMLLLESMVQANMNMVRIWGGGIYEENIFYDLCDALGLVVWQDFMFANERYPMADPAFRANTEAEFVDNLRRLRHHACIGLWCGNNEIELVARNWGPEYWKEHWDYFKKFLPAIVRREDPQRDYWPGSPHGGAYNDPDQGDAHTWDVWHGRKPFEWYRTAMHRFCSEFGFQSFPEPKTVDGYTIASDRNITAPVMEHHQRNNAGNEIIFHYMLEWFRVPKDFNSMLWASQLLQALAIQYAVEHWRRNVPRCMGALYWQLNDCWPVASWASIDYHGRWKALHYVARRFFAPVLLSLVEDADRGHFDLHVSADALAKGKGQIQWQAVTLQGKTVASGNTSITVRPGKNFRAARVSLSREVAEHGRENLLLFAELILAGKTLSCTHGAFVKPKRMEFADPEIRADIQAENAGEFRVTLTAKRPALWAWLELQGMDATYEDNFFDLCPGRPITVRIVTENKLTVAELKKKLLIRSLADLY